MGQKKLADSLGMSIPKAKALLSTYDEGFPFMKELMRYCMEVADERGFVKTVLGRRRRFDMWEPPYFRKGLFPIKGRDVAITKYGVVRRAHLHKAMNSIIQGSAAEQMKRALVQLYSEKIQLLITLYDEIGASINSEAQASRIKEITENAISFTVPQVMEYKIMKSWGGI
jgi:DNA polymerase I-like protein with 3'-5' exonuclease and polymerase domains